MKTFVWLLMGSEIHAGSSAIIIGYKPGLGIGSVLGDLSTLGHHSTIFTRSISFGLVGINI